jgi:hypothetical protein
MERRLRIFEMDEDANPIALAESQLLSDLFPWEYAATRARRAIDLRSSRNDDASLRAFTMLPVGQLVSGSSRPLVLPIRGASARLEILPVSLQMVCVNVARYDPPTPARRNGESRSGWRTGGSGTRGGVSAGSRGARSSGCASSRVFLARDRGVLVVKRGGGGGGGRRRGRR